MRDKVVPAMAKLREIGRRDRSADAARDLAAADVSRDAVREVVGHAQEIQAAGARAVLCSRPLESPSCGPLHRRRCTCTRHHSASSTSSRLSRQPSWYPSCKTALDLGCHANWRGSSGPGSTASRSRDPNFRATERSSLIESSRVTTSRRAAGSTRGVPLNGACKAYVNGAGDRKFQPVRRHVGSEKRNDAMGILEKLRPQPRWKHADPAVRAAAVYDLGPDEAEALRALAREDAEARVRRAAVTRHRRRRRARARSRGPIRTRTCVPRRFAGWPALAAEADDPAQAIDAVRQLARARPDEGDRARRPRQLRARPCAPRSSICSTTRRRSAPISRHAQDAQRGCARWRGCTDAEEILNVALKSEHTDAAVAALERDRRDARRSAAIAQRARNKVAGAPRAHQAAPDRGGGAAGAADTGRAR